MPAPTMYVASKDISSILHISVSSAHNLMNRFEKAGKTVSIGRNGKRVSVKNLAEYIASQDGSDPIQLRNEIVSAMRAKQ